MLEDKVNISVSELRRPAWEAPGALQVTAQGCELPSRSINHQAKAVEVEEDADERLDPEHRAAGVSQIDGARLPRAQRSCTQGGDGRCNRSPACLGLKHRGRAGPMFVALWPGWRGRGETTLQLVLRWKMPQSHGIKNSEEISKYFT